MKHLALALAFLLAAAAHGAEPWPTRLFLGGTDTWHARIPVDLANHSAEPLAGYPVPVTIGQAPGQLDLVGQPARALRVADSAGTELLFDLRAPDGRRVDDGPIPAGSTLTLPIAAAAGETARVYLYFEHPATWPVPEFLEGAAGLIDVGCESDGNWRFTAVDARHRLARVTTAAHTGQSCLRCEVDDGAQSRWTTAHQTGIAMRPGRRYRVSAWVKGDGVVGTAGWFVHVATGTDPMAVSLLEKAGDGTFDWRPVSLEFTAPPGALSLDTGTILYGTGTAWYDDARLEALDPEPEVTVTAGGVERLKLTETRPQRPFVAGYECRLPVYVINPGEALPSALVQVRISRAKALLHRGFSAASLRLVDPAGGAVVPCLELGQDLLFTAAIPARSRKVFDLYFSRDARLKGGAGSSYQALLDSPANLAVNPSFEQGGALPDDWIPVTGGGKEPAVSLQRVAGGPFGGHCARTTTAAAGAWTGWSQTHAVQPNTDYLFLCRSRTIDLADQPARLNAHLLDAAANRQFWAAGPDLSGTSDWTLVGGRLHTGAGTQQVILYPTTNARGTVEHDGVVFARTVSAEAGEVECRPERGGPEVRAWVEDPLVKVFRDTPPGTMPRQVALSAPRGGEEALQLCLRVPRDRADVRVSLDPPRLGGVTFPPARIERVGFVPSLVPSGFFDSRAKPWERRVTLGQARTDGWCGWWPDYLTPVGRMFALAAGRTQPLWITFPVPRDAVPGDYTTTLRVAAGAGLAAQFQVRLRVWKLQLPERPGLQAIFDLRDGPWAPHPVLQRRDEWWRFMARHHLSTDRIEPQPAFRLENGEVRMDTVEFDRAAALAFDELHTAAAYFPSVFYAAGWGMAPRDFLGLKPGTPEYDRAYTDAVSLFWEHLKQKGWSDRFSLYVSDEPFDQDAKVVADLGAIIRLVRAVDPSIPVYSSTWHPVPAWNGLLNHWGVGQYGCFPLDALHQRQAAGDKVWLTVDGQLDLDTPFNACERMLSYYCFAHDLSGFEHWAIAWFTDDPYRFGWYGYLFHRFSPERTSWVRYPSGSGHLAYPGPDGEPVSTIRLENVRAGLEDYEVLAALKRLQPEKPADRAAVEKVLAEVAQLCVIPNAGGFRSTEILPVPERLTEVRVRAGELVNALRR